MLICNNIDCVGRVWYLYYWIESQTPKAMRKYMVEANVYNAYFISELIVESLPQLLLNVTNAHFQDQWNEISIVSAAFSGAIISYAVIKYVYYVGYHDYDMKQIML